MYHVGQSDWLDVGALATVAVGKVSINLLLVPEVTRDERAESIGSSDRRRRHSPQSS